LRASFVHGSFEPYIYHRRFGVRLDIHHTSLCASLAIELGYIEGQNIAIEYRYSEGKRGRLPELAAELVRLKVDIIVAGGGDPSIRAAKNATKTIPIVMTGGGLDPIEAGYVESLARPGGNVTGFTNLTRELGGKNGWSRSKKLFRELPVSRFSTIQLIRPVYVR
jgi:hypothetical protein